MNFDALQRLDFPGFGGWSSRPIAVSSNGDVLMALGASGFNGSPTLSMYPASVIDPPSGSVLPLRLSAPTENLIGLSNSSVILSSLPIGIYQANGTWATLPLSGNSGASVFGINSQSQIAGVFFDATEKADRTVSCLLNPSATEPLGLKPALPHSASEALH